MTQGVRLGTAVMYVRDVDRSVSFYRDVLGLQVVDRSTTAALLGSDGGAQLILRAMGDTAAHTLGTVGVQYVVWTAASEDHLDQHERLLREHAAFRERRRSAELVTVEGRDPDDTVLVIVYPGPDKAPLRELPARIYAW